MLLKFYHIGRFGASMWMPFCNKIYYLLGAGTTFCYLDDFCTGNSNQIKERALLKELRQRLEEEVNFNIRVILREVYEVTRADMAAGEKDQFYARYIKPMHIEIDQDGEVYLRLGEK